MTSDPNAPDANAREERIRALAHHIWEAEGRPEGQADRHWAMAERLVEAEMEVERARAARVAKASKPPSRGSSAPRGRDGRADRRSERADDRREAGRDDRPRSRP